MSVLTAKSRQPRKKPELHQYNSIPGMERREVMLSSLNSLLTVPAPVIHGKNISWHIALG